MPCPHRIHHQNVFHFLAPFISFGATIRAFES
jgi:hypothetical protein